MYVNLEAYKPVARLSGNLYARLGEKFTLVRQTYAEWQASRVSAAKAQRLPEPS